MSKHKLELPTPFIVDSSKLPEFKEAKRKVVNCITINTDASFSNTHKVGGYAFVIVCDIFRIQKGGQFKKIKPACPEEAEIMCIGNAISTLLSQTELPTSNHLVLNSDCKWGMAKIRNKTTPLSKQVHGLWQELIRRTGATHHSLRHVKAHSGIGDKRSMVNEWCDKEAKKWTGVALKEKGVGNEI